TLAEEAGMDSRARVVAALTGQEPDKVPIALGFYRIELADIAPAEEAERHRVDVRFVSFRPSQSQQDFQDYVSRLPRDTRIGGPSLLRTYYEWGYQPELVGASPLAGARHPADLDAYPWPDVTAAYRHEGMAEEVAALQGRGYAVACGLPHLGGEMYETAWRLRGFQRFNLDLLEREPLAAALLDRLVILATTNAISVASAGVDVLVLDDDIGMPGGMILGPDLWRHYLKPRLTQVIMAARSVNPGLHILYHSDGVIDPILEDLIAIGINAINPVQPDRMDPAAVRRRVGRRLALWGTVGNHATLSYGTPESIREEVRLRVETLGRRCLVLCPAYDVDEPDMQWANLHAFLEAAEEFG
ncbi:MAG: uroporphyrinogen decarboxylase family protein, partial [Anaerolineae bacterium]